MENKPEVLDHSEETLLEKIEGLNPLVFIAVSILIAVATTAISFFGFERPPTEYTRAGTFVDTRQQSSEKSDEPQFDPLAPVTANPSSSDLDQALVEIDTVFGEIDEAKALTPTQLSNQSLGLE